MSEFIHYIEAASSISDNIFNPAVEGRIRKVSMAALDYVCKLNKGCKLNFEQKKIVGIILTLGKHINDYYDVGSLDSSKYKDLRKEFKRLIPEKNSDFKRYQKELSRVEKQRPLPSQLLGDEEVRFNHIRSYRERVNKLYLSFAFAIALDKPMASYYEDYNSQSEKDIQIFEGFFNSVMAMQVVDDIVGREGDLINDRPSFYTAFCTVDEIQNKTVINDKKTFQNLNVLFSHYYDNANSYSLPELKPILSAVKFTKNIYPKITQLARKYKFLGNIPCIDILTERDRNNL